MKTRATASDGSSAEKGTPPPLALTEYVSLGDGTYRAVTRKPVPAISVRQAALIAGYPTKTIYRRLAADFITGHRPTPRKLVIDLDSLSRHLRAHKEPDFWTKARQLAYHGTWARR